MIVSRPTVVTSRRTVPPSGAEGRFGSTHSTASPLIPPDPQRTNLSEFSPSDLQHINRELTRYHYGKPLHELLKPNNHFRVYPHYPYVILQNFQFLPTPIEDKPQSIWGICHELALTLAQRIFNRQVNISHPKDLNVEAVTGQAPRYFNYPTATHVFLMAFRDKHRRQIERQLDDPSREIPHRTFEDNLDSPKCIVPDHAIVIDPSFGVTQGHADHDSYHIFRLFSMDSLVKAAKDVRFNVMGFLSLTDDGIPSTGQIPLGYVKDLIPGPHVELPANAMIHLGFTTPKVPTRPSDIAKPPPIQAELFIQRGPHERVKRWPAWDTHVPKHTLLHQMMTQIQADLLKPDPGFCEQLNRRYPFETNNLFNISRKLLGWG